MHHQRARRRVVHGYRTRVPARTRISGPGGPELLPHFPEREDADGRAARAIRMPSARADVEARVGACRP